MAFIKIVNFRLQGASFRVKLRYREIPRAAEAASFGNGSSSISFTPRYEFARFFQHPWSKWWWTRASTRKFIERRKKWTLTKIEPRVRLYALHEPKKDFDRRFVTTFSKCPTRENVLEKYHTCVSKIQNESFSRTFVPDEINFRTAWETRAHAIHKRNDNIVPGTKRIARDSSN